jgi:hypothetical protein
LVWRLFDVHKHFIEHEVQKVLVCAQ